MADKITKDMKIGDIVEKYPKAAEKLWEMGLMCVMCHMAKDETLEQGAITHELDPDELVKELNKVIE